MADSNNLLLTVLPNGWTRDQSQVRLSVLVTPSLADSDGKGKAGWQIPSPFNKWAEVGSLLQWTVSFCDATKTPVRTIGTAPPASVATDPLNASSVPESELWRTVFGAVDSVKKRQQTKPLRDSWRISHNATSLHKRHTLNRLVHAVRHIIKTNAPDQLATCDEVIDDTKAPAIFLHPEFKSAAGTASDLADKFADRNLVLKNWAPVYAPLSQGEQNTLLRRVDYTTKTLETYGGAKLSAIGLSALYISCLHSVEPAGTSDPKVATAIATVKGWPASLPFAAKDYPDIEVVRVYIEMLLFHRRQQPAKPKDCSITKPDFHQLLGLVHNYPAVMRRLGLVFDLVVAPPQNMDWSKVNAVTITANVPAGNHDLDGLTQPPVYTRCSVDSGKHLFSSTPRDPNLLQNGLLNLNIKLADTSPRFTLVAENAEGQSLKHTDQSNNASRSAEYTTSAPTSMKPVPAALPGMSSTPSATASPTDAPPAPRTVGIAMFDQSRLTQVEQSANQSLASPTVFFAEDLILGYRVDILYKSKSATKSKFYSLCERSSNYQFYKPNWNDGDTPVYSWSPASEMEKAADEGFLSFGATQSPLDPNKDTGDSSNTMTQLHQSVFTWVGWSLCVPQPNIPSMNPTQEDPSCQQIKSQRHLSIKPIYALKPDKKLPPLRFDTNYAVRCRITDLAGNSLPPEYDADNSQNPGLALTPLSTFSRQEPYRAPHFLLREPIDHLGDPGTHLDRMVLRDGTGRSKRILVAPRESLRLAELSGVLTNASLPKTAYGDQQLMPDGSFPSVACSKQKGWVMGKISEKGDQDPIYLPRHLDGPKLISPYLPDPKANYIRVDAYQVMDDPSQSRLLCTHWASINRGSEWIERLPLRVLALPPELVVPPEKEPDPAAPTAPEPRVDLMEHADEDGNVNPTEPSLLKVILPKAATVLLVFRTCPNSRDYHTHKHPVQLSQMLKSHFDGGAIDSLSGTGTISRDTKNAFQVIIGSLSDPDSALAAFTDGSIDTVSPSRTMTLVHAVKSPLREPEFSHTIKPFNVARSFGKTQAMVTGQISAHWPSTSKLTCYAEWTDCIDDPNKDRPYEEQHREVAFTLGAQDFLPDSPAAPTQINRLRTLGPNVMHHFSDTRAHRVTYSLVASGNFREYYPAGDAAKDFQLTSKKTAKITVQSSVRPKSLPLKYLIPAFIWRDAYDHKTRTWCTGRRVVLRAYFDRPLFDSGNGEKLAVILDDGKGTANEAHISRWGGDPTRPAAAAIEKMELTPTNFAGSGDPVGVTLAEGGTALAKHFDLQYSHDRRLWFSDIELDTQGANAPFVRLSLARWQPDGLTDYNNNDCRCSPVVAADFMQVANDRWVSVNKSDHGVYSLTISGAFPNDSHNCPFVITLYKRWFAMDQDMGWRKVQYSGCNFRFVSPNGPTPGYWTATIKTPSPTWLSHYRVLIEEWAYPQGGAAACGSQEPGPGMPTATPTGPKMLSIFVNLR